MTRRLDPAMNINCVLLIVFGFAVLENAVAQPLKGLKHYKAENCIPMSPQKEQEMNAVVDKVTNFLHSLMMEHENFDIRLIKLDIEQHSDDEIDEKETVLQLTVNDCAKIEFQDGQHGNENQNGGQPSEKENLGAKPVVMELNLPEDGQKVLNALNKKKRKISPVVVYVQEDKGRERYWFLN